MDAGIQIFNDNNSLIIDGTYRNYRLLSKGTVSINPAVTVDGYAAANAKIQYQGKVGSVPVIAIRSDGGICGISFTLKSGNNYTFYLSGGPFSGAQASATFQYYIFDLVQPTEDNGGPFVVWNEQGQVVFDSSLEYLIPTATYTDATIESKWEQGFLSGERKIQLPAGRDYAIALFSGALDYYQEYNTYGGQAVYVQDVIDCPQVGINSQGLANYAVRTVYTSDERYFGNSAGPANYRREGAYFMAFIDVTGFK